MISRTNRVGKNIYKDKEEKQISSPTISGNAGGDNELDSSISSISGIEFNGLNNYEGLRNKPSINEVELIGDKTGKQLGLQEKMDSLTNLELDELIEF